MDSVTGDVGALENRLQYPFAKQDLLWEALTHPSYLQQNPEEVSHNQRLEFLGDAVLSAIVAERLFRDYPEEREGLLTRYRAVLVRGQNLVALAGELGLAEFVRVGLGTAKGEDGRVRPSVLEDVMEALVGAVFLDSDYETARRVVLGWLGPLPARIEGLLGTHNPKGRLQEWIQPEHGNEAIAYELLETEGPPHQRRYRARVIINGEPAGEGAGRSKKEAEENAARVALQRKKGEA